MSSTPYPFGQTVRIPVAVRDGSGVLTNPVTLGLTIKLPDGSTVTFPIGALTNPSVGTFYYDYPTAIAGHYAYRYQATAPTTAIEGEFDVSTSLLDSDAGQLFGWPGSYLTLAEFKAMPTGVNVTDLIANGSAAANDAELANVLRRASRWCDTHCTIQIGAHTVTAERQSVRVGRDGMIRISPRQVSGTEASGIPLVSMSRIAYGRPGQLQTVTTPIAQWIQDNTFLTPIVSGPISWSGPQIQFGFSGAPGRLWVEYDYIAGFPITTFTAATTAATTSLPLADVTGIQPGQTLAIHDPGVEEQVTVATSWTPTTGAAPVPLAAATLYAHLAGAGAGAIPEAVKEAVCLAAVAYIRRSTDAGTGPSPALDTGTGADASASMDSAAELLEPYIRDGAD